MRKNNKTKIIIVFIVWIVLLVTIPVISINMQEKISSENNTYISSDYDIESYDVILDVDKDNKVDVTENIKINIPSNNYNGIYKSFSLWQNYYNKDMKNVKKRVQISNLRAIGEKFVLDKSKNNIGLRIGSSRTNIDEGLHTYTIKYRYNMGKDENKGFDEFVFNIFENYKNTKINNLTVTINMPFNFDENQIKFMKKNEDISKAVSYIVEDKTVKISINNYELKDTFTVNIKLKDGYFTSGTNNYGLVSFIACISIIIITIVSAFWWKKYGKDNKKRVQTVEFYAPDNLDPAQIGYIYGEKSIKKLTASLIISLASKGYIEIKDMGNKQYKVINTKKDNLKELTITEQIVYNQLFVNENECIISQNSAFIKVFSKIQKCLKEVTDKKINDKASSKLADKVYILLIVSIIIWMISFVIINDLNPKYHILYLISFIAIFITGIFTIIMERKTDYGEIIYAKVLGFKNYLNVAQKNELDTMVEKNPNYFYDILPYAYVLGVSDKWIKNFEKENLPNINLNSLQYYENDLFMIITE